MWVRGVSVLIAPARPALLLLASSYRDHLTTRHSDKILLRLGEDLTVLLFVDDGISAEHGIGAMPDPGPAGLECRKYEVLNLNFGHQKPNRH